MDKPKAIATVLAANIFLTSCAIQANLIRRHNENNSKQTQYEEVIDTPKPTEQEIDIPEETQYIEKNPWYETNDYAYLNTGSILYSDFDLCVPIEEISAYQKVQRISSNGIIDYVLYEDGNYGFIQSQNLTVLPKDTFVEVDISDQTTYLINNYDEIFSTANVTGKDSSPTDLGCYSILYKEKDTDLVGPGYRSHVDFWMPFNQNGEGLHDADRWRYGVYGGEIYHENGSHGCVNMPLEATEIIYNNVDAGTLVLVHK